MAQRCNQVSLIVTRLLVCCFLGGRGFFPFFFPFFFPPWGWILAVFLAIRHSLQMFAQHNRE